MKYEIFLIDEKIDIFKKYKVNFRSYKQTIKVICENLDFINYPNYLIFQFEPHNKIPIACYKGKTGFAPDSSHTIKYNHRKLKMCKESFNFKPLNKNFYLYELRNKLKDSLLPVLIA